MGLYDQSKLTFYQIPLTKIPKPQRERLWRRHDQVATDPFVFDVFSDKLIQVFWKDKPSYDALATLYSKFSEKCFHMVRKNGNDVKRINIEYLKREVPYLEELLTVKNFENEFIGCMLWAAWNGHYAVRFVPFTPNGVDYGLLPDFP